jgi:hypothetical protein
MPLPLHSHRLLLRSATALVLTLSLAHVARAQVRDTLPPVCLGFSFGQWNPPLNWRGAGHGAPPDTSGLARTAENRDWAVNGMVGVEDSLLVLYPRWWPAGVAVTLPTRRPAPGDTIAGTAQALVADGRKTNPSARVRAWSVRCGGPG